MAQEQGDTISQASFVESPYVDSSWEVVGEEKVSDDFIPMEIEPLGADQLTSDPMFADYGGTTGKSQQRRWHLPEHLSADVPESTEPGEAEESVTRLTDAQLEAIKAEAFTAGQQHGQQQAEEHNAQKMKGLDDKMTILLNDMQRQLVQNAEEIERGALSLALEISEKLVGYAVEINPEYIVTLINQALGKAGGATIHRIRMSPEDFEFVEVVGIAKQIKDFDGSWTFEPDETIRSGCVVETVAGEVDFQLDKAWERIKDAVLKSKV